MDSLKDLCIKCTYTMARLPVTFEGISFRTARPALAEVPL